MEGLWQNLQVKTLTLRVFVYDLSKSGFRRIFLLRFDSNNFFLFALFFFFFPFGKIDKKAHWGKAVFHIALICTPHCVPRALLGKARPFFSFHTADLTRGAAHTDQLQCNSSPLWNSHFIQSYNRKLDITSAFIFERVSRPLTSTVVAGCSSIGSPISSVKASFLHVRFLHLHL